MKFEVSAGGIVYKKTGKEILWLICSDSRDNRWVFPKGHVADKIKDEKMEDAALREVREETGIISTIIQKLPDKNEYFFKKNSETIKKYTHYFLMEYKGGDTADHDFEMNDAKFVMEDEARNLLFYNLDKKSFKQALKLYSKHV